MMNFDPIVDGEPRPMDPRIFADEPMGLRGDLLALPIEERFSYDAEKNVLFVNFEGLNVDSVELIEALRNEVESRLDPLGRRVYGVVNYDNFTVSPDVVDRYTVMVKGLMDRYYLDVTRYTTSAFLRMKLGEALASRDVAPHIYESREEARAKLGLD
jgi:propionate CoA-transferase